MPTEFKLPPLGEGVESADVADVLVSEGESIEAEQNVLQLETEKAVADLPCPHAGTVAKIHVSIGDTVSVGQTLLTLEGTGTEEPAESEQKADKKKHQAEQAETPPKTKPQREKKKAQPKETAAAKEKPKGKPPSRKQAKTQDETERKARPEPATPRADKGPPPPAGPATRRLARKLHVDLEDLEGSGPGGRISLEDVAQTHAERTAGRPAPPPLPDFSRYGPVEDEPLSAVMQTAIDRLNLSWQIIPHVTQHALADITDLEAARRAHQQQAGESGPNVTLTAIAVKAAAAVLQEFPRFNASLDAENKRLILKRHYHIGIAVDTEHGLLVPVLRDAGRKTITELAAETAALAEKARAGRLKAGDMEGGTFTISNQGGLGGLLFTPII
ncbi:MAG: 2-oxo acid dehydrogenase subunit E2, partial [Planctomycetaceae bacterium]